jgi:hypothetical protein
MIGLSNTDGQGPVMIKSAMKHSGPDEMKKMETRRGIVPTRRKFKKLLTKNCFPRREEIPSKEEMMDSFETDIIPLQVDPPKYLLTPVSFINFQQN